MEPGLLIASTTRESTRNASNDSNYGILPPLIRAPSLVSEIPERLLEDNATALCPAYNEQDVSTRHQLPHESTCVPQHRDSARQGQPSLQSHETMQERSEHVSEYSTALFQDWNHAEAGQSIRKPRSWKDKLGTFSIIVLITGSILLCAAVGTLAFLWFGDPDIQMRREIIGKNWLSKAISICIGVIQPIIMLQLGIMTATLASLALESKDVVIGDVASVSIMRATAASTGAFLMAWQYLSHGSFRAARHSRIFYLVISAALLWCLSQFLLLIILTDVSLRPTAGPVSLMNLPYDLNYYTYSENETSWAYNQWILPSAGAWSKKIAFYASFAEYSEPAYEADGVSDTGVTLRAFLPFGTAQDREKLKSYKGKATLLDARVTCQVPRIKNATLSPEGRFQGSLAPTRQTPRLINASFGVDTSAGRLEAMDFHSNMSRDFDCFINWRYTPQRSPEWKISLCQLWQNDEKSVGGLLSEFYDPSQMEEVSVYDRLYLFLNNTLDTEYDFDRETGVADASHKRGEWLDLSYWNGEFILSASVCYAAFDFADIDVRISSQSNRTESRLEPIFYQDTARFTFQELRYAMGQDHGVPIDKRGMLEIEKGSWHAEDQTINSSSFESELLRFTADLAYTPALFSDNPLTNTSTVTGILSSYGTCTSYLGCVLPEHMHVWLLQEILMTNGSIAFALQTMITLLSSMAYYDRISLFDKWTQAELAFFTIAQVPVSYIGFVVVMITVAAHCILMAYCVSLFLRNTALSRLGASWSAVAQVATGDIIGYLGHATQASDNDIQDSLKEDGVKSSKVCLKEIDGQVSIFLCGKDEDK